ncbi:hypothetical protein CJJ17_13200 [Gordonia polyisoprenivorans]|nr:hypothetical protein CJJ17_13200 [Gordonia polyisoprenivorans]
MMASAKHNGSSPTDSRFGLGPPIFSQRKRLRSMDADGKLALGYITSLLIFVAIIAAITTSNYLICLNAVLAFWAAFIVTRPLGASLGDLLTQPRDAGGFGVGTTVTNLVFLVVMIALVVYLSVTHIDRIEQRTARTAARSTAVS